MAVLGKLHTKALLLKQLSNLKEYL